MPVETPTDAPPVQVLAGNPTLSLAFGRWPIQLRVVKVEDALWLPRRVIINLANGKVLLDALRKPHVANVKGLSERVQGEMHPRVIERALADPSLWRVSEPAFCAASRNTGYGHVLLEAVSQLWPSPELDLSRMRVAVNAVRGDYPLALMRPLGVREETVVRMRARPVRFEQLVLASQSLVIPRRISERFWPVTQRISDHYADGVTGRRLYVSRLKAHKRRLDNEAEIERVFERYGFQVVYPEERSVADQVRLFSGAEWVAGPVGSGLYNSVFSRRDVRRLILAPGLFFTPTDSLMSARYGPLYMFGESPTTHPKKAVREDWTMNTDRLRGTLDGLFT